MRARLGCTIPGPRTADPVLDDNGRNPAHPRPDVPPSLLARAARANRRPRDHVAPSVDDRNFNRLCLLAKHCCDGRVTGRTALERDPNDLTAEVLTETR